MSSIASESSSPNHSRLGPADAFGISIGIVLLMIASYLRSRHRMFWGDEIMGWFVLKQPSFSSLLHVWYGGMDSSGIFFYVFGRPWMALFGSSEVSLRMYSAAGIAGCFAFIWISARRFYSIWIVAVGTASIFVFSRALYWQLANGRTYGVFMFACAFVVYLLFRAYEQPRTTISLLLLTFAGHLLLVGSHILGAFYSAIFLGTLVALDISAKRFRPALYLSGLLGWIALIVSWQNLLATAALAKPSFWTSRPSLRDIVLSSTTMDIRLQLIMVGLLALLGLPMLRFRMQRKPLYFVTASFFVMAALLFAKSCVGTSIYVDRYLMPLNIGIAFMICELMTQIDEAKTTPNLLRRFLPLGVAAALLLSLLQQRAPWYPQSDYTQRLLASIPAGVPVVSCDPGVFVDLEFYRHNAGHQIYFPVDWGIFLDPNNGSGGVSGYHEMDNWKRLGFYSQDILPGDDVLGRVKDFIVITDPDHTLWLRKKVLADPKFTVTPYSTFNSTLSSYQLSLVHAR